MHDLASFSNHLLRDVLWQSTTIFLIGMLVARYVRLPARAHAILAMTFLGAVITPLASGVVRQCGWGMLEPPAAATAEAVAKSEVVVPQPESMVAPPRLPGRRQWSPTQAALRRRLAWSWRLPATRLRTAHRGPA